MRSYDAARRSFGVLEFFAKALIGVGFLAALPALMALETRGAIALVGAVPGVAIIAMGFFGQAYVQTARATVDGAEYAQQALGLAREQFEISKHMLRLAEGPEAAATYAAATGTTKPSSISFDTQAPTTAQATTASLAAAITQDPSAKISAETSPQAIEDTSDRDTSVEPLLAGKAREAVPAAPSKHMVKHLGVEIERTSAGYEIAGTVFPSLQKAKEHIEIS